MSSLDNDKKDNRKGILQLFDENSEGITMQTILLYIYLIAIFGVYPVITHNKYFDITITRYTFFMGATVIYFLAVLAVSLVGGIIYPYAKRTVSSSIQKKPFYTRPEFWMEAFLMANVFSWIVTDYKDTSLKGDNGRYMGLVTFIAISIMFIIISEGNRINIAIFMVLAAVTLYAFIVAIYQHVGNDFMGYRDNIRQDLYNIYISTFGNINIFASFLTMCIPIFMCIYIFSDKIEYEIVAAVITNLGGMVLMVANSDSGFMGVAVASVVIFLLSVKDKKFLRFCKTIFMLATGVFVQVIINRKVLNYKNNRGGISVALDNIKLMTVIIATLIIVYILMQIIYKKCIDKLEEMDGKKLVRNIVIIMLASVIAFIAVGKVMELSFFDIDYKWGNYRGMIWHICADIFDKAPWVNKIFGYGNDALKYLTKAGYYDIMMENTNRVYDNAHNELLQYLVTTGIVGAVSYLGLFVSAFAYILKNSNKKPMAYITLAAITGYFAQGMVNVNQPITTPFYFVLMALGVGYVRYMEKQEATCD